MAGHSKWANIKHKKAKEDAKRGKVFTKLIKEITVVARDGGGDPEGNPRLRLLIEKARQANMPADNINRAIKKGTGELEGANYEPVTYEGYGPCGVAVMVEALTDNKNRTVADVRHVFTKSGGNLAEGGAVAWMFGHKSVVSLSGVTSSEDDLLEEFLDHGVEDIEMGDDGAVRLIAAVADMFTLKAAAESAGYTVSDAQLEWVASTKATIEDEDAQEKVFKFLDKLDELDDVQQVYANIA